MITGALLLKKEEPISVVLKKRFSKFLIILLFSALIIYLYFLNWDFSKFSLSSFLKQVYSTNITTSLWYLYAFLAYILMLPFLRKMAQRMTATDYAYLTGLMVLISSLRCFELLFFDYEVHYHSDFNLFSTMDIVYYPLMGDFLANKLNDDKITLKMTLLSCAVGLIFKIVNCWLTCIWCEHLGEWEYKTCQNFLHRYIFFPAIALFIAMRYIFIKVQLGELAKKCITYLGSCTFGIYLFERIYREETLFIFNSLSLYIPRFAACLIWIISAFCLGLAVTAFAKKIPLLRKFL